MNLRVGTDGPPDMIPRDGVSDTLARRWERLQQLDEPLRSGRARIGASPTTTSTTGAPGRS